MDGFDEPVTLVRRRDAVRLTLRIDPRTSAIRVTAPLGLSEREVARFVARHRGWIEKRRAAAPAGRGFADGAVVPLLGVDHLIRHVPDQGVPVTRADGELRVGGDADFLARRLRDWLVAEARRELSDRARAKAVRIDRRVAGISVRDTRSRWGSCSSQGRLNFSWRLILAPEPVLDYVVAHEVAHLAEMNHGPRFWSLCADLAEADVAGAKGWLKRHGAGLHRYG
ncbi:MAG: SprT family zinc-dependent metalloprotease [Azospirillaceae bacterium]